ncbi:hypothetical protein HYW36_01450 [Candidatus Saccharibacteria bacterium]|nr:hypothetical protein [Candidatus Saccharibacteria bacterium]
MSRKRIVSLVLTASLLALPIIGFWQRQNIYDWAKLRDYDPPQAVVALANAGTMNDKARRIFYVNHPQLLGDTNSFRQNCSAAEQTIILGCYHPTQAGIYVYDVQDERLGGIEEVTSAHEMLHAAYDRLSSKDKKYVHGLLQDYYQNHLSDERIKATIEAYKKTEPNDLLNEMHSIFGTEIPTLPRTLEDYYSRYFSNRAAVVAFSQKYEGEFTNRRTKAEQYEVQIKDLKANIDAQETNLKDQLARLQSEEARLDSLRNSNQIETYNNQVASYNASVDTYNAGVTRYKRDVERYNSLVEQYNAVAGELRQLYGAIDTRLQAQTVR